MEICRICLNEAGIESESIETCVSDDRTLGEMIEFISGIQINPIENLPKKVCHGCTINIVSASNLKQICIDSDKVLRSVADKVKLETSQSTYFDNVVKIEFLEKECDIELQDESNVEYLQSDADCSDSETSKPNRINHKEIPVSPSSVKCHICNEKFQLKKEKLEHLEMFHNNEEFKCQICHHKSQTAKGYDNHLMLHENPDLLSHLCHLCSKNFQKACQLRRHIKISHYDKSKRENNYSCDLCEFKTFCKINMKRHIRTLHLKIRAFQCESCPHKKYTSKTSLDQHMIAHHGRGSDFVCISCNRKFPTRSYLRSHMKTCSGSPVGVRVRGNPNLYREQIGVSDNYRCKMCSLIVAGKGKMAQHYVQKHKHSNKCNTCSASFNCYSNLKKHIQIVHNKVLKFTCSFCGKTFGQKNQLLSHENIHTGEKPFVCLFDFCSFRTGDPSALSKHRKKCQKNQQRQ